MPPKITRVKWSAQNLPYGVSFNEQTGTFTGTPEDIGEYTVPVTVETNYGRDTKDVMIIVEPPLYGAYAIGAKARTWSKNAQPDTDGFYGLSIPRMEKLSSWPEGFRAYKTNGDIYGCGVTEAWYTRYTGPYWETKDEPYRIGEFSPSESPIKCYLSTGANGLTEVYVMATLTEDGHMNIKHKCFYTILMNGITRETYSGTVGSFPIEFPLKVSGVGTYTSGVSIRWLSEDGEKYSDLIYSIDKGKNTATPIVGVGSNIYSFSPITKYRAVKFLSPCTFTYLSESMLLDNKAENFTHGTIKDVWGYDKTVYVQTTENELYEYVSSSSTWDLLGTYDIKKVEVHSGGNLFMLTNDGKLYHKGNAITGLFSAAQDSLTQVAISSAVIDFAFSGNTLTVLKE